MTRYSWVFLLELIKTCYWYLQSTEISIIFIKILLARRELILWKKWKMLILLYIPALKLLHRICILCLNLAGTYFFRINAFQVDLSIKICLSRSYLPSSLKFSQVFFFRESEEFLLIHKNEQKIKIKFQNKNVILTYLHFSI